jgi:hypothetical protein
MYRETTTGGRAIEASASFLLMACNHKLSLRESDFLKYVWLAWFCWATVGISKRMETVSIC